MNFLADPHTLDLRKLSMYFFSLYSAKNFHTFSLVYPNCQHHYFYILILFETFKVTETAEITNIVYIEMSKRSVIAIFFFSPKLGFGFVGITCSFYGIDSLFGHVFLILRLSLFFFFLHGSFYDPKHSKYP